MSGPLRNLENVEKVSSQVSTGNGIFDILLRRPDKWFVCIELKVDSPETSAQTERYAEATGSVISTRANTAGLTSTSTLLPKEAPASSLGGLRRYLLGHIVVTELETVLTDGFGKYPSKEQRTTGGFHRYDSTRTEHGRHQPDFRKRPYCTPNTPRPSIECKDAFERDKERLSTIRLRRRSSRSSAMMNGPRTPDRIRIFQLYKPGGETSGQD